MITPRDLRQLLHDRVGVERHEPLDLQVVGDDALLAASCSIASRITPSVEPQPTSVTSASAGPNSVGGSMTRQDAVHLAHALFVHRLAFVRIGVLVADQPAFVVVLVGGDHVDVAWRAGERARRDAAVGDLVALVARPSVRPLASVAVQRR